ncbi:MAG: L-threonylcarbamoyladenylate synthase [Methylotenera sp.]|nr:L-threonylcarbamoyladenylate synthase [Methylotenera sp.]MDP1959662.1 L-threonylcarbamoyladenylate synthase [Methylotenera sp.]MDP3302980.1 L-threonylcarbamoyladenylate synthase [Methylotenera sp.]MDP3943258.1 L-threonylcarbamoyladenylate synthase [Methylotenera sp.]
MRVSLEQAIAKLKQGEVVAIPTETVYGLAADATNDTALKKIFSIKQRPADHPLIVHISDISQVKDWVTVFPDVAIKLATAFWPGPLTLVLPAKIHVSRVVRGGESTVALRIPSHPLALTLLKQSGLSVAAPSANLFTQLSPTTAQHVEAGLGEAIPVLDGGACNVGIESTIVSVAANGQWQLLRPGMISEEDIANIANVELTNLTTSNEAAGVIDICVSQTTPKVPGQHALHYSPRTPLRLFNNRVSLNQACKTFAEAHVTCAAMLIGNGDVPSCTTMTLPDQPNKVAEQLYSMLHSLDAMQVDCLLIELPPNTPEWAAVLDRLRRAGYQ